MLKTNKISKWAFTIAEMMVVLLIISIVLAAFLPVLTSRPKGIAGSPWKWTGNNSDIYYGAGDAQTAMIGTNQRLTTTKTNPRLILQTPQNSKITERSFISFQQAGVADEILKLAADKDGNIALVGPKGISSATPPVFSGTKSILIGTLATAKPCAGASVVSADPENSISIGHAATTQGKQNIALGGIAKAYVSNAIAIGHDAMAYGKVSLAIGSSDSTNTTSTSNGPKASRDNSIAIGSNSTSTGIASLALGTDSDANGQESIALGYNAYAPDKNSTAVGSGAKAQVDDSTALGYHAETLGNGSTAIGAYAYAAKGSSTALGSLALAMEGESIAIGSMANAQSNRAIAIGYSAAASNPTNSPSIAIGADAYAEQDASVAIGTNAYAINGFSIAIGMNTRATKSSSIALGYDAQATGYKSVAIGAQVKNHTDNTILIGNPSATYTIRLQPADAIYLDAPTFLNGGELIPSDKRLKNIEGLSNAGLSEIEKIKVYNYTLKSDKKKTHKVGVVAQELQKIMPSAVTTDNKGFLAVAYDNIFLAGINAIKELSAKFNNFVTQVEAQNIEFRKQIAQLQKDVAKLQKDNAKMQQDIKSLQKAVKSLQKAD